jgi:hypothetical protein
MASLRDSLLCDGVARDSLVRDGVVSRLSVREVALLTSAPARQDRARVWERRDFPEHLVAL